MYWSVMGMFSVVEVVLDTFVFWYVSTQQHTEKVSQQALESIV